MCTYLNEEDRVQGTTFLIKDNQKDELFQLITLCLSNTYNSKKIGYFDRKIVPLLEEININKERTTNIPGSSLFL